jgi:TRAP-type C4-dicarboxylate transport system substrate-binding protein
MEKARAAGVQVTSLSPKDKKAFQDAVKPVWDKYGTQFADTIKRIQQVG